MRSLPAIAAGVIFLVATSPDLDLIRPQQGERPQGLYHGTKVTNEPPPGQGQLYPLVITVLCVGPCSRVRRISMCSIFISFSTLAARCACSDKPLARALPFQFVRRVLASAGAGAVCWGSFVIVVRSAGTLYARGRTCTPTLVDNRSVFARCPQSTRIPEFWTLRFALGRAQKPALFGRGVKRTPSLDPPF